MRYLDRRSSPQRAEVSRVLRTGLAVDLERQPRRGARGGLRAVVLGPHECLRSNGAHPAPRVPRPGAHEHCGPRAPHGVRRQRAATSSASYRGVGQVRALLHRGRKRLHRSREPWGAANPGNLYIDDVEFLLFPSLESDMLDATAALDVYRRPPDCSGDQDDHDFTASDLCCACGGGRTVWGTCAWTESTASAGSEEFVANVSSPEECLSAVAAQCSSATSAMLPTAGAGPCFCVYGYPSPSSSGWAACVLESAAWDEPPESEDSSSSWTVDYGECTVSGLCIHSAKPHGFHACRLFAHEPIRSYTLSAVMLDLDPIVDKLYVNGVFYRHDPVPALQDTSTLNGVLPTGDIIWHTHSTGKGEGWTLCAEPPQMCSDSAGEATDADSHGCQAYTSSEQKCSAEVQVGYPPTSRSSFDSDPVDGPVVVNIPIGVNGTLTKFELFAGFPVYVELQVWRPVSAYKYSLVGWKAHTMEGGFQSVDASIQVEESDVIGWFVPSQDEPVPQPILFDEGGRMVRFLSTQAISGWIFGQVSSDDDAPEKARAYSIRATVEVTAYEGADDVDFTASDMCCACGGGDTASWKTCAWVESNWNDAEEILGLRSRLLQQRA
ncbi:unnamed protein product [Prorocentrum cordatum]|uniref:Beta-galactosidase n=1 Tax=Prorocentrum cordatum TaxID=2364126 RepID=A0ABN9PJA9_9DINO|nr:unnamed protein product [Polarella glacialis]